MSFRTLKYLSFTHSAVYTCLLVVAIAGGMDGTKKAVWVIIILLLPLLGMILWFLLGKK